MEKYDPQVFKTSLLGVSMFVLWGPAGNKFLFSNENKLVKLRWPCSVKKLLKSSLVAVVGDEAKRMRRILFTFLDPDALKRYIERMDLAKQDHIRTCWEGKEDVKVQPTANLYTFEVACRLFKSIDDPRHISKLAAQFDVFLKGVVSFAINIPGTRFYHASKAADANKEQLRLIARQRRGSTDEKMVSPKPDLLSHLVVTADASGNFLTEMEIFDNISGSTHMDPVLFPKAEDFDVSRFEGAGLAPYSYVPFGGGPRICLGNEYVRPQILLFLHNIMKIFKWDLLIPDEKVVYDPMPTPCQGLPIRLQPCQTSA